MLKQKARAKGVVRIVGGRHRGRKLTFPALAALRPTPDRLKETLFNWLGQQVSGSDCLDLFAGSGSLGFEALSRGARQATLVEHHGEAVRALRASADLLKVTESVRIIEADACLWLRKPLGVSHRYHLIFTDPPFDSNYLALVLARVPELLQPQGLLYVETSASYKWPFQDIPFELLKTSRAGDVKGRLLSYCP